MDFKHFTLKVSLRLGGLMIAMCAGCYLLIAPGYPVATLIALIACTLLALDLFRVTTQTNRELTRFLDTARHADYGQRFKFEQNGSGFGDLRRAFEAILQRFQSDRTKQQVELRQLQALLEQVPTPLLSIHPEGTLTLWNNAARRLFGTTKVTQLDDLATFGAAIPTALRGAEVGTRLLLNFHIDNQELGFSIDSSELTIGTQTQRLVSMQNIQQELNQNQLQAWQDLVRVLTHEIMNSVTPVSSLAKTAVDLVDDIAAKTTRSGTELTATATQELVDIRSAVATVARRSDGLMNFVTSYRQLAQLPTPTKTKFAVNDLFLGVSQIASSQWGGDGPTLRHTAKPAYLELYTDRQMVEQVLINLTQNAYNATRETDKASIDLNAGINSRGQTFIEVTDNGPGVPEDIEHQIFLPFFTTRKEGNGVGLALSRQIMIANGGNLSGGNNPEGGARFVLLF